MSNALAQSWWVWALRGLAAIIFGLLALFYPGITLTTMIYVFGAYAVIDGAIEIYNAVVHRGTNWGWQLLEGLVSILAGIAAFMMPLIASVTILYIIAIWAIITGVMQMVMAWQQREVIDNEIWLGLAGLMSVIFGILVFFDPFAGLLSTVWVIGIYSIIFGVMMIALAFRYRGTSTTPDDSGTRSPLSHSA